MDILVGLIYFVSGVVSFLYGTRIAWGCGRSCHSKENPRTKKQVLRGALPTATVLYLFGFMLVFNYFFDGFLTVYIFSLTSSILLSHFVVSMSMPELKRNPVKDYDEDLEEVASDAS